MLAAQFQEMFEDVEGVLQRYTIAHILIFVLTAHLRELRLQPTSTNQHSGSLTLLL